MISIYVLASHEENNLKKRCLHKLNKTFWAYFNIYLAWLHSAQWNNPSPTMSYWIVTTIDLCHDGIGRWATTWCCLIAFIYNPKRSISCTHKCKCYERNEHLAYTTNQFAFCDWDDRSKKTQIDKNLGNQKPQPFNVYY